MKMLQILSICISFGLIASCTNESQPTSSAEPSETGTLSMTVHAGTIGALSKTAAIEMTNLYVQLSSPGLQTIYDTLSLSGGSSERTERQTYTDLASRVRNSIVEWTLAVESRDQNGTIIHSGDTVFTVPPRDTIDIEMFLAAQYSMLVANFFPIRDSVTECKIKVDGTIKNTIAFAKQSRLGDTISLTYDYLQASPLGVSQNIEMNVYGQYWGVDTLLYTGDTTISVKSGQNNNYQVKLKYVGPAALQGAATMVVSLGAVGIVTTDGVLTRDEFLEDFNASTLSDKWQVVEFQGTRTNGFTSPAGHYSLTDHTGYFRYLVDPLTTQVGFWNDFHSSFGYYWYDPSLELRRTFEGTNWTLETKFIAYLPYTNGRSCNFDVNFGNGTTGSIRFSFGIGRDLGDPGISCGISKVTGPYNPSNGSPQMVSLANSGNLSFSSGAGDLDTVSYELSRNGNILQARYRFGTGVWQDFLIFDTDILLTDLTQTIVIVGGSWFSTAGSYFDFDYVKLTQY